MQHSFEKGGNLSAPRFQSYTHGKLFVILILTSGAGEACNILFIVSIARKACDTRFTTSSLRQSYLVNAGM